MTPEAVIKVSKALADPTRFRLLQAIAATDEIACGALAARFPITQATCSQHLKVLVDAGLIAMRREGQFNYYRLVRPTLEAYRRAVGEAFAGVTPVA
jgi:ArsR family transcriptional regulator, arsenate/arsenite/antimonite-responsive transcriptional repressor